MFSSNLRLAHYPSGAHPLTIYTINRLSHNYFLRMPKYKVLKLLSLAIEQFIDSATVDIHFFGIIENIILWYISFAVGSTGKPHVCI